MSTISQSQMAKLFGRLAMSYGAGIDILTVFKRESEIGSPSYRQKMIRISEHIQNGMSISQAMEESEYFPNLALAVVEAGEQGGRLQDTFHRLNSHYDTMVKFRNGFVRSLSWPAFNLFAAIAIIGLLILGLGAVASFTRTEPLITFGTGTAVGAFIIYSVVVMFLLSGVVALVIGTMQGWFGTVPMRIARRIPLIGKTIEAFSLSRFAWTMSVAENAGMDAVETIGLAAKSTQNFYYTNHQQAMCESVQSGKQFMPTMKATEVFPDEFLIHVSNGELAGSLAESMDRASVDLRYRAEQNLKMIGKIGFVMVMGFVSVIIMITIFVLYMKLYIEPLNELIKNPMGCLGLFCW